MPFLYKPRQVQQEIHDNLKRFNVLVLHRRCGKTVFAIHEMIEQVLECKKLNPRGYYIAPLFRQAKQVAWDYCKHTARLIPGSKINESELRVDFSNGARVQLLGADSPDSLRGVYADFLVADEYGQMSPRLWTEIMRPALADREGRAIFIGTPMGRGNNFYDLWCFAQEDPDWYACMLKASETGIIPEAELAAMRKQMRKEEYAQELECSWSAAIRGAYYAEAIDDLDSAGRITSIQYDPTLPVHTGHDLGISDSWSIWYAQIQGNQIYFIDHDEVQGSGIPDIVKLLDSKGYKYGTHVFPHDFKARELGTGVSRQETAAKLGMRGKVCRMLDVADGIDAVRSALPRCWFDRDNCFYGLEALRAYRTEYDEKRRIFRTTPLHDWSSHSADAMRYFMIEMAKGGGMYSTGIDYSAHDAAMGHRSRRSEFDVKGYSRHG
jgi:hypothetical protein